MTEACVNWQLQGGICQGEGGHVLVTEIRDMALNGLFCADVLRPLDIVPPPSLTLPTNTTVVNCIHA